MSVLKINARKKNDYFKKDFYCFILLLLYYFGMATFWDINMKVKVYFNLHRKLFSVVNIKTGKVIDHSYGLSLNDPEFRVQQGGRRRVLREQRKNVHAYVVGNLDLCYSVPNEAIETTYNPYKYNSFVLKYNKKPITKAYKTFLQVKDSKAQIYTLL